MNMYKTRGIILRSRKQAEADRIITVISPEMGIFDAKIRGALKPKSKLGPACQHFATVDLTLASGRVLDTVTETSLVRPSTPLEEDITSLAYASLACEITLKMSAERQPDLRAYTLLDGLIGALEAGVSPPLAASAFMLKRLYIDGIMPQMAACSSCSAKEALHWFSAETGGVLCAPCASSEPGAVRFEPESRQLAITLYRSTWEQIAGLRADRGCLSDLEAALVSFICYRGDIRLKSLETLGLLREYPGDGEGCA
ncbi:MAG TPA: DNA repair protein RecO [Bacillota bacterium]|nr:DNA repair protein RecO [Bacillota bacterium]HOH10915.1 DNA repair protein RecO [Bacillota bacterium]HOY89710.1 DNA repair protein RecO [Bacillota bacterium]HPI01897.1 DNA repair protein RecO [Bacillota bacterium]HPM64114.1 DNA repair protein RecO [Bacillota bacterium]